MITIEGKISEIIYQNSENGFTIAIVKSQDSGEVTVTGCMPSARQMDNIKVEGLWKTHEIYGRQLDVKEFEHLAIDSLDGITGYLSSGAVEGIGLKMAEKIVQRFGMKSIEILEQHPERYLTIDGIGKKKLDKMVKSHMEGRELKAVIVAFSPYGITPAYCMKIFKKYKDESVKKVKENPYALCRDISGIGFRKADEIAKKLNAGLDTEDRVQQGIIYILKEAAYSGHTYLDIEQLTKKAGVLLGMDDEKIISNIFELSIQGTIIIEQRDDEKRVYLWMYNLAETRSASNLIGLLETEDFDYKAHKVQMEKSLQNTTKEASPLNSEDSKMGSPDNGKTSGSSKNEKLNIDELIDSLQKQHHINLSHLQLDAARCALSSKVMVLTGGPGTGKTTTLDFIIKAFESLEKEIVLCAPTGRAAKRMTQATGKSASTIHRLLEAGYSQEDEMVVFAKDEDEPIKADVIIADEISMIDIMLFDSLLQAIKKGTVLILVGDKDQLPSVGAGSVLRDILDSDTIPAVRLTEVFRQASESDIVVNAHKINQGELPRLNEKGKDFFFMQRSSSLDAAELIVELVSKRLPEFYGFDRSQIQVLSPMRKSEAGVNNLNAMLQQAINPDQMGKREHKMQNRILRTGDRVMHIKNNYEKKWENLTDNSSGEGIFNGDIGIIDFIEPNDKKLWVSFDDGKRAEYDFTELDEIEHAFATTVHKSQGSEFECVVMPIVSLPPMLLSRKILYTAITRAKKLVVLTGQLRYLKSMVSNVHEEVRNTALADKLRIYRDNEMLIKEPADGDNIPF